MQFFAATFVLLLAVNVQASLERPANLREAIKVAIKENPQTVSTDEFLESVHFSTLAAKAARLPMAQLFCSTGLSHTGTSYSSLPSSISRSGSYSCGVSASYTLYDGGAGKARYRAAQAAEEATRNSYNTADALMENTKGKVAYSTMMTYSQLALMQDALKVSLRVSQILATFSKFSAHENLTSLIADHEISIKETTDHIRSLRDDFKHHVTLDAAEEVEGLDATIAALVAPPTADHARAIALKEGPEVLRREALVEMAQWNLKALRAEHGPRVSLSASVSRGSYHDFAPSGLNSGYTDKRIGVTAVIPFSFGAKHELRAAQKSLASKKSEQRAAIAEAEYTINSTYNTLEDAKSSYLVLAKNFTDQMALVEEMARKIEAGDTSKLEILGMIAAVKTLGDRYDSLASKQIKMVMSLFSIQQVTGLLFTKFAPIETNKPTSPNP